MDVRYLVLALFFLVSCVPTPTVSKGSLASSNSTSGSSGGNTSSPSSSEFNWNYLGQLVKNITVNVSNLNSAYLVGSPVETYLATSENFSNANYCLISSFSVGGVTHELRSRAVPISYYDFTQRRTVKNLRVDFPDVANSGSLCSTSTPARVLSSTGTYVSDPSTPPLAKRFNHPQICSGCTSILTASRVRLFKVNPTQNTIDEVPSASIQTGSLQMQIDPNSSINGGSGTCSTSQCNSRGFDCCLDNQCVNDGTIKPAAQSQYPTQLQTAEQERLQNPLAYLNYPHLYYICGTTVPTTTGGNGGGSTGGTTGTDPAFEQLKKDYQCIEYLKSRATVTPFHLEVLSADYSPGATDCLTSAGQETATFYYKNVLKRMYTTCGCNRTDLTDMVNNCPNYDYNVVTRDTNNQPLRIDCYTPPTPTPPVPSQQTVTVSSRSAPHRFFDNDGTEKAPASGTEQEGDKFEYLDEGKILPIQQPFSMNAILGQMSVALDKALPAKSVSVEIDQIYFLTTTSGYYTPCPSCAKDSWLSSFSAFPSTSSGVGLQATGHSTTRDAFSTNTTAGNYEDTIFGRACWLPPTMIPFGHSPKTSAQTQRLNRLKTQAALFVNGYQRDWFGFNKGALIGSFDGVTWFAIGKGRIVRSTSRKLFLAINAPFADVASPTLHVVNVQAYDGITQAAQVDYDPQYHQYHSLQNEAGNCQKYHLCSTDTDCVTKLGWEYACADVRNLTTKWPEFDANGNEKVSTSQTLTIDKILLQKRFPSSSTKRCVYRGAGATCHMNSGTLADLSRKKLLTCAPNFYCANPSSSLHNNKIARYAALLEDIPATRNHFFGKDANIMGRPHDYMGSASIASDIRSTLAENLSTYEPSMTSNTGICQPGKNLPTTGTEVTLSNPFNQHMSVDPSRRSDYISQIGSCNSTLFTVNRHSSCPVIGSDGNYEIFKSTFSISGYSKTASNQNACGLESLLETASLGSSADMLQNSSPFRTIEARPLNSQIILDRTLVRDACFRRAGAACHTDLDCSPNKLHSDQAELYGLPFFGNQAEKDYWSEYLVCAQTDPKPLPSDGDVFRDYDMSKNLCCREVGKNLTTYTRDIPTSTTGLEYDESSAGLKASTPPGTGPIVKDPLRYSRLATVDKLLETVEWPILTALKPPVVPFPFLYSGFNVLTPYQWKTLGEANSESCCGGGWIRKFSDGTTDWTRRNRVVLDVNNFKCINSRSILLTTPEDALPFYTPMSLSQLQSMVGSDYSSYCKDADNTRGACAQYGISPKSYEVPPKADPYDSETVINTLDPDYLGNGDFYFMPKSADADSSVTINLADDGLSARRNINLRLPSYVTNELKTRYDAGAMTLSVNLQSTDDLLICQKDTGAAPLSPATPPVSNGCGGASGCCYFQYSEPIPSNPTVRQLKIWMNQSAATRFDDKRVGVEIRIPAPGYSTNSLVRINRKKPGSATWYLKRLGRLELSGIPQITHEVLTCNDNSRRVVQGIFSPEISLIDDFENSSYSFPQNITVKQENGTDDPTPHTTFHTNNTGLQHEPVFSANDFKCCTPLGKTVTKTANCCSGYAVNQTQSGNLKTCALPPGTNLMVYFNRFVSNEGRGSTAPGGGLVDGDFDERTGEPLIKASVNDKIRSLGLAYCDSGKIRQGGAFGEYEPEPQGPETNLSRRIYNILDSSRDIGTASNAGTSYQTGYFAFSDGFRWNHHLYCDD